MQGWNAFTEAITNVVQSNLDADRSTKSKRQVTYGITNQNLSYNSFSKKILQSILNSERKKATKLNREAQMPFINFPVYNFVRGLEFED